MLKPGQILQRLKGFLPEAFGGQAAPSAVAPLPSHDIEVSLLTLSAAIGPILEAHGLTRDNKSDIAKGWQTLADTMTKLTSVARTQVTNDYITLRNNVAFIAGEINSAPKGSLSVQVAKIAFNEVLEKIDCLNRMAEYLGDQPINLQYVSSQVTFISGKPLAKHFPTLTSDGGTALLLQKTHQTIGAYMRGAFTPDAYVTLNNETTSDAQPHAKV